MQRVGCENFEANQVGRSQLGYSSKGLAVGSTQIGQFKEHVVDRKGKPCPEHDAAHARYKRQCLQWKMYLA